MGGWTSDRRSAARGAARQHIAWEARWQRRTLQLKTRQTISTVTVMSHIPLARVASADPREATVLET